MLLRFCFRRLLRVRSPWLQCYCNALQSVRFFLRSLLLFARGCACVRFRAVFWLFICRLRCFLCFCNTLPAVRTFARLCCLYCSRVWLANNSLFVRPQFGDSTTRRGKDGRRAGGQAPAASVGAFYSLRSPSASRCSFSATK